MPITDIDSYVTTADDFITHWNDVNTDRVANSLTELQLPGAYSLASFTTDRDALQTAISSLEGHDNSVSIAASNRDTAKELLLERLRQFRSASDLYLKNTSYAGAVPTVPSISVAESKFLHPFDDVADLWARVDADSGIDGFTPPLQLRGSYTLAGFNADIQTVRDLYRAVRDAENDRDIARRQRDALLGPLKDRMLEYRTAIDLEYGEGHPFHDTVPSATPSPGSTPDAVTLQGVLG